ncbi:MULTISPECIES: HDOD domain-containing protein [unclassified Pseudomonas]|uniref:HDOD domain-containing protein n=1 Tax=unclassified Pseudomonas TaxID=196821 RepID=UPI000BD90691|nr:MULTISPECIES: HDOD domain-containing protein [unclassified Pseudomonas]PVZ12511.1 HD-like signal output (HDOD) protein [Pseudomonas sp. URIL14HWK12:I12]PVZ23337.1 HD-like signal output (HDOD) protein [Pseudomonas sp. URIL14HWK12:I10]PVZ32667.1 HD-like signal output (HDOD) protein [Pseudomonas sp. URIL14HWK12:I11]SNZ13821.1 HD-like signal output (HDOD) domain, no enzymatic activity [Pseudomonas sp. URIL14HWK12:I9]
MEIETLFAQIHTLPSIPKVAQDLILQFDNPTSSLDAVARNIEKDPVISAKILRLANSARFRGARESTSIEDAASRLGFNTLRTLVLASAVTGAFKAGPSFDIKGFWLKSFEVASVARILAKKSGADAEIAFTSGVMHNIGELLIQIGAPEVAERVNAAHRGNTAGHVASESLQLGFGYPEVGAELTRRWNLPKVIQNAIAYQAKPLQAPNNEVQPRILAQAILVSDALETYGGLSEEAKESLRTPLFDGVDLDALFQALPPVLEADKQFAELLS